MPDDLLSVPLTAHAAKDARAVRWVDDPWSAMTMDEAEAWRAGYAAAKAQALKVCVAAGDSGRPHAHDAAHAIAAMEPPA